MFNLIKVSLLQSLKGIFSATIKSNKHLSIAFCDLSLIFGTVTAGVGGFLFASGSTSKESRKIEYFNFLRIMHDYVFNYILVSIIQML